MALKKNPKDYREWIFAPGKYSEPDFLMIVSAVGATCTFLNENHSVALISPVEGREKATWEICKTMFEHVGSPQARRQLLHNFRNLAQNGPVVHTLRQGVPACGFTTAPQESWPTNHNWARVDEIEFITCPTCLKLARSWG